MPPTRAHTNLDATRLLLDRPRQIKTLFRHHFPRSLTVAYSSIIVVFLQDQPSPDFQRKLASCGQLPKTVTRNCQKQLHLVYSLPKRGALSETQSLDRPPPGHHVVRREKKNSTSSWQRLDKAHPIQAIYRHSPWLSRFFGTAFRPFHWFIKIFGQSHTHVL